MQIVNENSWWQKYGSFSDKMVDIYILDGPLNCLSGRSSTLLSHIF